MARSEQQSGSWSNHAICTAPRASSVRADLHVHSTASDGTLSPRELVGLASRNGVGVLALADHDSVDGVQEAVGFAAPLGILVIPAVELSAAVDERSVHILGYFIDITDGSLHAALADLRAARVERAVGIVQMLQGAGYDITPEAVMALSDGGAVGRTHIARTLVSLGHAENVSDAFERLVGRGKPFYRPKAHLSAHAAIQLIRGAGGIAVMAHPGVSGTEDLVSDLVALGLQGVEAHHVDHTAEQSASLVELAARLGLLKTGGTDYHSPSAPHPDLGELNYPLADLNEFLDAGSDAAQVL